jgi:hypothetical protein
MSREVTQFKSEIRDATYTDCLNLAPNLRPEDKDEVWESGSYLPEEALVMSFKSSADAKVVILDGEIVCMYGISVSEVEGMGIPWMLGTKRLRSVPKEFLERTLLIIEEYSRQYSLLANCVWSKNTVHIRWLEWLGFTIIRNPILLGRNQEIFYYFFKNQKE